MNDSISARFCVAFLFGAISLTACAPLPEVVISFDDSHQMFLDRTLSKLDMKEAVQHAIPAGASVCVVSMETEKTSDNPIVSMIEDNLLNQLISGVFFNDTATTEIYT